MKCSSVYIHSNIAAPYRRHLFEAIAEAFPKSKAFLYESMPPDRPWTDAYADWRLPVHRFRWQIRFPKIGYLAPALFFEILRQPKGTMHLIGACQANLWLLILFGRLRGGRLIFWSDGGFSEERSARFLRIFRRFLLPAFVGAFAPGQIGRSYSRYLGFSDKQIFNAFFSHDTVLYDRLRKEHGDEFRQKVRARLGINSAAFVVLNVSRFIGWKRLEDLGAALISLGTSLGGNAHLILVGDGAHRKPLEVMRTEMSNVRLHYISSVPWDEMPAWYAASDLFVFPSEGDIWGLVVNESLSMGVPVICTSRIGAAELVRNDENGYQVPVRAPDEIARRIKELFDEPALLYKMKTSSPDIVHQWNSSMAVKELRRLADS